MLWLTDKLGKNVRRPVFFKERWAGGAHLPFKGYEPVGEDITIVCDAWPVRRQTYRGYIPLPQGITALGTEPNYTA